MPELCGPGLLAALGSPPAARVIMVRMPSALERKLIVVTGKGGVGKTTVSAALGLLGARRGLRTIVVEVTGGEAGSDAAGTSRLSALLGRTEPPTPGVEVELLEGQLWGLSIDRDRVLAEWLRAIGGRVPARVLTSSSSFQYLIAAAPGAREMLSMVKVWELAQGRRPADRAGRGRSSADRAGRGRSSADRAGRGRSSAEGTPDYDLVVLDAPATGHALAMLRSPQTFSAIARVGPIARQSGQVRELLENPTHSAYLAVTQATEMGVTETLELRENLRRELGRELHAVVVNGTLPRRFQSDELRRIAALDGAPAGVRTHARQSATTSAASVTRSAVRAAHAAHERARSQQNQIARLRRSAQSGDSPLVLRTPFLFRSELDLEAVQRIADQLGRGL